MTDYCRTSSHLSGKGRGNLKGKKKAESSDESEETDTETSETDFKIDEGSDKEGSDEEEMSKGKKRRIPKKSFSNSEYLDRILKPWKFKAEKNLNSKSNTANGPTTGTSKVNSQDESNCKKTPFKFAKSHQSGADDNVPHNFSPLNSTRRTPLRQNKSPKSRVNSAKTPYSEKKRQIDPNKNTDADEKDAKLKRFARQIKTIIEFAEDFAEVNTVEDVGQDQNANKNTISSEKKKRKPVFQEGGRIVVEEFLSACSIDSPGPDKNKTADKNKTEDRVTISTIHKAKGLEWKYVFIPHFNESFLPLNPRDDDDGSKARKDPNRQFRKYTQKAPPQVPRTKGKGSRSKGKGNLPNSDDLDHHFQEECRLAHVAITRAQKRCYLLHSRKIYNFIKREEVKWKRSSIELGGKEDRWLKFETFGEISEEEFEEMNGGGFFRNSNRNFNPGVGREDYRSSGSGGGFQNNYNKFEYEDPYECRINNVIEKRKFELALKEMGLTRQSDPPVDYCDMTGALKIPPDDVLKSAYRKRSLIVHPDKCKNPLDLREYTAKFQALKQAYDEIVKKVNDFREGIRAKTG